MTFNKKITTISLILLMIIAAVSLNTGGLSNANAQPQPLTKQSSAYLGLIPDTVGVNQEVLIHLGIYSTQANVNIGWQGLTITVVKPDGTTQTLGPFTTDATGGTGATYTPNQVGTYTFQTHFPEQQVPETYFDLNTGLLFLVGSTFLASDSDVVSLVVTEDPIQYYPDTPLPTEFWSRPIDSQFRGWSGIAGNWLEPPPSFSTGYAPYNDGPETAHILWAKPLTAGGLAGGDTGEHGMEEGDAYEGKWQGALIINGILYYNEYGSGFGGKSGTVDRVHAVDLRTGEELWKKEGMRVSFGQTFYFDSFNYHGVFGYLWEEQSSPGPGGPFGPPGPATWNAYDPYTGDWEWSITDVPSGIRYTGDNGEFYILVTDFENG